MQRLHVNLSVKDLDTSIRFYSTLFGAKPTVLKKDYAKWLLDDPRVNFSIALGDGEPGIRHLGIQAESREELMSLRTRVEESRGKVFDEGETTCCYARSDKVWVTDAQGILWENFYTHGESETFYEAAPVADEERCCKPACETVNA